MTQITIWEHPPRTGTFCEACTPTSGSAILPPEYRTSLAGRLTHRLDELEETLP